VWADRKTPLDALNSAVARGNALLEEFEAANAPAGGGGRKSRARK